MATVKYPTAAAILRPGVPGTSVPGASGNRTSGVPQQKTGYAPTVRAMSARPRDPAALIPPTIDEMSKLRWVAILSAFVSLVALGIAIWAKLSSTFDSLTVNHLKVTPSNANHEGILIEFEDNDSMYPGVMSGMRVLMPKALGAGSTAQSGVRVVGGQYAVYADEQVNSGLQTDQVRHAVSASGGDDQYLILNDGHNVYTTLSTTSTPS